MAEVLLPTLVFPAVFQGMMVDASAPKPKFSVAFNSVSITPLQIGGVSYVVDFGTCQSLRDKLCPQLALRRE